MSFGMCGQRPAPGSARTQLGVVRPTAGTLPRVTTAEIREGFLRYFEREGHLRIPSASLVPFEDDPSVLLTIAGMQPLKSYFLGMSEPPALRMTSAQKCFRTLDIDQVGRTARHLTFFEMLGNFSIGDYFKDDAIRFGFELSTEVLGFDPEQIWITVFEGMDGVPADDEALERWVELGIPRDRIQRLGEADNFWKAGPTGPCGPNTELYLDRGPSFGPEGGPVTGTDRFLEFWNLVFMQYDRAEDGTLTTLPAKNIDTGAGLERLAAILQDKQTVFETDGFRPLIAWAEKASGRAYNADPRVDRAMRVLADHGRAMTFLASDGVRPGNEGRDYVLRRIIRRAVSEGAYLGLEPARVVGLVQAVADGYGDAYPEIAAERSTVEDVIGAEAEQFARTLEQGTKLLGEVLDRSRAAGVIAGDDAFRLHDTFGFPLDLTRDAAEEHSLQVDEEGFGRLMTEQRDRARAAGKKGGGADRARAVEPVVGAARHDHDGSETGTAARRHLPVWHGHARRADHVGQVGVPRNQGAGKAGLCRVVLRRRRQSGAPPDGADLAAGNAVHRHAGRAGRQNRDAQRRRTDQRECGGAANLHPGFRRHAPGL